MLELISCAVSWGEFGYVIMDWRGSICCCWLSAHGNVFRGWNYDHEYTTIMYSFQLLTHITNRVYLFVPRTKQCVRTLQICATYEDVDTLYASQIWCDCVDTSLKRYLMFREIKLHGKYTSMAGFRTTISGVCESNVWRGT